MAFYSGCFLSDLIIKLTIYYIEGCSVILDGSVIAVVEDTIFDHEECAVVLSNTCVIYDLAVCKEVPCICRSIGSIVILPQAAYICAKASCCKQEHTAVIGIQTIRILVQLAVVDHEPVLVIFCEAVFSLNLALRQEVPCTINKIQTVCLILENALCKVELAAIVLIDTGECLIYLVILVETPNAVLVLNQAILLNSGILRIFRLCIALSDCLFCCFANLACADPVSGITRCVALYPI